MGNKAISQALQTIYQKLMACYGPQHWWPAREPFEVMVGAILTQSAAWVNVVKAIDSLRAAGALSPEALRRLPQTEIARLIYSCGYYNTKARKLQSFVRYFGGQYHDSLEEMSDADTGQLREQLLGIYGIGEETADSIMLYAVGKPVFVIDAYTRRIIDRMGIAPASKKYQTYQEVFTDNLPPDTALFNEYHALLVRLAKVTCRPKPLCPECCLNLPDTTPGDSENSQFPCAAIASGIS